MIKLYVYDHCPYCVRARMIFGLKQLSYTLKYLLNDDEANPIRMVGKKMVPILEKSDGSFMPESMDIVTYIDQRYGSPILTGKPSPKFFPLLEELDGDAFRKLVTPRYISLSLPEFATKGAVQYFSDKKQKSLGNFDTCLADTANLSKTVEALLIKVDSYIQSEHAVNGQLSTDDIYLFPLLRNLSVVKGLVFPERVKNYMQSMSRQSQVDLYFDRAI